MNLGRPSKAGTQQGEKRDERLTLGDPVLERPGSTQRSLHDHYPSYQSRQCKILAKYLTAVSAYYCNEVDPVATLKCLPDLVAI